jgi:hypothetical protein
MTFELELSRRSLFAGLGALIAAPAIVRAASLMPVRAIVPVRLTLNDITREWITQFQNGNEYPPLNKVNRAWMNMFLRAGDVSLLKNSDSFIWNAA